MRVSRATALGLALATVASACAPTFEDPGPIVELRDDATTPVGPGARVALDEGGAWTIEEVRADPERLRPAAPNRPNLGFVRGTLWLRMDLRPPGARGGPRQRWLIAFGNPRPHRVRVWASDATGWSERAVSGTFVPPDDRPEPGRALVVPLELAPGERTTVHLAVEGKRLAIQAELGRPATLRRADRLPDLLFGAYYGLLFALFVYNFFLFVALRDRAYLFYVVYLLCLAVFFLGYNGYAYELGWDPATSWFGHGEFASVSMAAILLLARDLLHTRRTMPRLDRWLRILVGVALLNAALALAGLHRLSMPASGAIVGLTLPSILAAALPRWIGAGDRVAALLAVGWSIYVSGSFVFALFAVAVIPWSPFVEHAGQVASTIELLLLSVALAVRVRGLDARRAAAEEAAAASERQREALRRRAREDARRREIAGEERERRRIARELHDGIGHLLLQIRRAADEDDVDAEAVRALGERGVAEVRSIARDLYPQRLELLGLAGALEALASEADGARTAVTFHHDGPEPTVEEDVAIHVYRIAQEALRNALDHGSPSRVDLRLRVRDDALELVVEDDGVGFDPDPVREGIGLVGMSERAALVEGTLAVESAPSEGTRIALAVPLAQSASPST